MEIKGVKSDLSKATTPVVKVCFVTVAGLFAAIALSGCLVAGVSSNGAFIWPGGTGLLLLVLLAFLLMRRR
jgi:hypothetical protein